MKKIFLIAGLILIASLCAVAQIVMPDFHPFTGTDAEVAGKLFQWYSLLFYAAGYVVTKLSSRIPWLKKVDSLAWRAVIVGVILIAIFIAMGAKAAPVISAFLLLVNPYELLKPLLGETKSVAQVKAIKASKRIAKESNQ